jgi:hypothetical protein
MALKTVEKSLLSHYGPKSIQMQKALKMDGGAVINLDTDEVAYVDNDPTPEPSKPDFGSEKPETSEVKDVKVVEEKPKVEQVKQVEKKAEEKPTVNQLKLIQGYIKIAGLKEEDVLKFLGELVGDAKTVAQLEAQEPDIFRMLCEQHEDILKKVKGV